MKTTFSFNSIRLGFFGFNLLFWFIGWVSLCVGLWLYVAKTDFVNLAPASYGALSAAGLCIAAGATVIVIGVVGCCGALVESKCLLGTYFIFVLLIFIVELTAGTLGLLHRQEVMTVVRDEMYAHLNNPAIGDSNSSDYRPARKMWDRVQTQFKCCGVDNYRDWFNSAAWPNEAWVLPSCCKPEFRTSQEIETYRQAGLNQSESDSSALDTAAALSKTCDRSQDGQKWYQKGCYEVFSQWLLEHLHVVEVVGFLFATIQVFGLISSLLLYCGIRQRQYDFRR